MPISISGSYLFVTIYLGDVKFFALLLQLRQLCRDYPMLYQQNCRTKCQRRRNSYQSVRHCGPILKEDWWDSWRTGISII